MGREPMIQAPELQGSFESCAMNSPTTNGCHQADAAEQAARRATGQRSPWRDLPDSFGPYTTGYNRFVRWRRAGVWGKIMNALAGAHDANALMSPRPS